MQPAAKATHQQTRAYNEALVLRTIYDLGPLSRAEVSRRTGLTRTSVGDIVGGLLADRLVAEVGRGPSSGGKAPILLQVVDDARLIVAVDTGEDAFVGALVDLRGRVVTVLEATAHANDGEAALRSLLDLVDRLIGAAPEGSVLGVGIGTPGIVDVESGIIRWAVNLDWQDLELGRILQEHTGLPTYVANDSRAAALAESLFDGAHRAANLVAIKVGVGIGAGIILRGELVHGDGFGAGEIGHTVIEDDGAACRCGRFGCLETVASAPAIERAATAAAVADPGSMLGRRLATHGRLDLEDVRMALESGDETARRVVVAAGRALGRVIAGVVGTLNVRQVVLLGSVTSLGAPWLEAVRDETGRRSLGMLAADTEIGIGRTVEDIVIVGAAALLMTHELGLVPAR